MFVVSVTGHEDTQVATRSQSEKTCDTFSRPRLQLHGVITRQSLPQAAGDESIEDLLITAHKYQANTLHLWQITGNVHCNLWPALPQLVSTNLGFDCRN